MKKFIIVVILFLSYSLNATNVYYFQDNDSTTNRNDTSAIKNQKTLNELIVTEKRFTNENGVYGFDVEKVKPIVNIMGETDVVRFVTTLPGISSGMEGGLSYFVRGGNNGNNRIELDNVPVYGSTHFFGLVSSFQSEYISSVDFHTSNFPITSGNFTSSLMQIKSIKPDSIKYHGSLSVSPYILGLSSNGKINNKLGYVVGGRYSLLGLEYNLLQKLIKTETNVDLKTDVGDIFVKMTYDLNKNNQFYLEGYYSNDYLSVWVESMELILNWNNSFINFDWNYLISPYLKLHSFAYIDNYFSAQGQKNTDEYRELKIKSQIQEVNLQSELYYNYHSWKIISGIKTKYNHYMPAAENILSGKDNQNTFNDTYNSKLIDLFCSSTYTFHSYDFSIGVKQGFYKSGTYFTNPLELKLNTFWKIDKHSSLYAGYDYLTQNQHTLEGLPLGWSIDLIVPASIKLPVEKSRQLYIGHNTHYEKISSSFGVFYKTMDNLVSYKNPSNLFGVQNSDWQDQISVGKGKSYGLEVYLEKHGEWWNGSLSYTLSNTTRQFNEINDGKVFPFKFDRRHILNANSKVQVYKNSKKKSFRFINLSISYSTGNHATVQQGWYEGVDNPYWSSFSSGDISGSMNTNMYNKRLMASVNGYTLPDYFRIDIGYSSIKKAKKNTSEFYVGIYNVLNRHNPYLIFYDDNQWKQFSLLPIIPTISYKISF